MKLSLAFCVFPSALCETVLLLFGVACQYLLLVMASKQQQAFRMCVHPCPRYLMGGDTHILCVARLGEEHARSALRCAGCEHCDCASPADTPIPPGALSRGRSGSRSPGLWLCRGTVKAGVLGFAKGSVSGGRDGHRLISAFT